MNEGYLCAVCGRAFEHSGDADGCHGPGNGFLAPTRERQAIEVLRSALFAIVRGDQTGFCAGIAAVALARSHTILAETQRSNSGEQTK